MSRIFFLGQILRIKNCGTSLRTGAEEDAPSIRNRDQAEPSWVMLLTQVLVVCAGNTL